MMLRLHKKLPKYLNPVKIFDIPNPNSIKIKSKLFNLSKTLKHSFKLFRLHRKSKNQVAAVYENISETKIMLPVNYKNNNYLSVLFRARIFPRFLPFAIMRLIFFPVKKYRPWAKQAEVTLKNPSNGNLYAGFKCSLDEIMKIRNGINANHQFTVLKTLRPINTDGNTVFCETSKSIYLPITKTAVSEQTR